jgi:hypothetical protein
MLLAEGIADRNFSNNSGDEMVKCRLKLYGLCFLILSLIGGLPLADAALAASITPYAGVLSPANAQNAVITITTPTGKTTATLADIETLPLVETKIDITGFDTGMYQGVRLIDFLKKYHLDAIPVLRFGALDAYSISITPEDVKNNAVVLATRFNGAPLDPGNKGPIMLLWPDLAGDKATQGLWIWSISEVGPNP